MTTIGTNGGDRAPDKMLRFLDKHKENQDDPSQQPQDGEQEEEEEEEEAMASFAENPMMDRVQQALRKQLQNTQDRVRLELLEQQEALRVAKKEREDCGVTMYGMQKQLARLQKNLEIANNEHRQVANARSANEGGISELKKTLAAKESSACELRKSVSQSQDELAALNSTIRQMKKYNDEMKGEIAVTRRVAYKAEENTKDLEKGKQHQDLYIDNLNEQTRKLEENIAITNTQLEAQKQQTEDAKQMLQETGSDLDLITFEKKQLMQQWKSSLLALNMRDEALAAASKALKVVENETKDNLVELEGLRREIENSSVGNEELCAVRDRLQNETKFIEESIRTIQSEKEATSETFELLQKSIANTKEDEKSASLKLAKLKRETTAVDFKNESAIKERQKLEERIGSNKYDQTTLKVATKNLLKSEKGLLPKIHEKEIEAANLHNELARIQIDKLNTEAHNLQLKDTLDEHVQALKEKDAMIEQHKTNIRRRRDEIEKKMAQVDRLNRKYKNMVDGAEEQEPLGPLEATLKCLVKVAENEEEDFRRLQHGWLADQTSLIETISELEAAQERIAEFNARLNILGHKRLRIIQEIHVNEAEVKAVTSSIQGMHTDMSRLNDLIGQNTKLQTNLSSENAVLEKEFVQEMKELESKSNRMDRQLYTTNAAKKDILDEMVDVERQMLVWEKKILLEKETQLTLKSSDELNDVKGMEKEIHRMKLRLEKLQRDQEAMVREMERAIYKREDIALKYKKCDKRNSLGSKNQAAPMTNAELQQKMVSLKNKVKVMMREALEYSNKANDLAPKLENIRSSLKNIMEAHRGEERRGNDLQSTINSKQYEKERLLAKLCRYRGMMDKYKALKNGEISPINGEQDVVEMEKRLAMEIDKMKQIKNVVNTLRVKFGPLDEVFDRVGYLIDDVVAEL